MLPRPVGLWAAGREEGASKSSRPSSLTLLTLPLFLFLSSSQSTFLLLNITAVFSSLSLSPWNFGDGTVDQNSMKQFCPLET